MLQGLAPKKKITDLKKRRGEGFGMRSGSLTVPACGIWHRKLPKWEDRGVPAILGGENEGFQLSLLKEVKQFRCLGS